ncbi:MAG: DUF1295 domain-containing protein [Cytophagales bacterium]|nr:DUF1295 domain-containing protein [Cytophagales bacterium]
MALQEEFEQQGNWLFKNRSLLPLIILVITLAYYFYKRIDNEFLSIDFEMDVFNYQMVCFAVSIFGLIIRIYTVGHTPEKTSGRNEKKGQLAESLNSTGIYSLVRHPLYVGNYFMWLGPALLTVNIWFIVSFTLMYWLYYEKIMFAEEQFLRGKFGETYLNWAKTLPAFVPNFKNFVKPELSFSLKKVLKKEKNGLAAVFLIFALFDISGKWIQGQDDYNYVFIYGTGVTFVIYLILKFINKKTTVLNEKGR